MDCEEEVADGAGRWMIRQGGGAEGGGDEIAEALPREGRHRTGAKEFELFGLLGGDDRHRFTEAVVELMEEGIALAFADVEDRHAGVAGGGDDERVEKRVAIEEKR